jgi:hypothetical protein
LICSCSSNPQITITISDPTIVAKEKKVKRLPLVVAVLCLMPVCALADTSVSIPSGWQPITFYGAVGATGTLGDADALNFTTASSVDFTVVDGFQLGDEYSVYNGTSSTGTLLGDTSAVIVDPTQNCGGDADACLADAWSNATFVLAPGTYSINIYQTVTPFGASTAYYEVSSTPEPGSLTLFGTGLLGLLGVARRRLGKKA